MKIRVKLLMICLSVVCLVGLNASFSFAADGNINFPEPIRAIINPTKPPRSIFPIPRFYPRKPPIRWIMPIRPAKPTPIAYNPVMPIIDNPKTPIGDVFSTPPIERLNPFPKHPIRWFGK